MAYLRSGDPARSLADYYPSWLDSLLEDYTAQVRGEPVSCVVLIARNAAGQTEHVVANYRPRSSLLLLSRLVGEKLADTPWPGTSPPVSPERS
jgi:hypothetical protein